MKKYSIFMVAALALGAFSSCEDAPAVAPMQENPQGPVISTSEFSIAPEATLNSVIDLDKYVSATELAVFSVASSELPEGMAMKGVMQVSNTQDFAEVFTCDLTEKEGVYYVNPGDLQDAHTDLIGDDILTECTMYYRVYGELYNVDTPDNTVRFGSFDNYLATGSFKETPMVSIMPTDYLYTPGVFNGWSQTASQYMYPKMKDGAVEYYYGSINVDPEFKICLEPNWDGPDWGAGENNTLVLGGSNIKATDGNGLYWVTADIKNLTYTMTKIKTISVIGGGSWDNDRNLTPNEDQTIWTGEVEIDGAWKIRMNNNWDMNYGGVLKSPTFNGDNFPGPKTAGKVTVTIDFHGHHPKITMK